jgi:hypothetical protein
MEIFDIFIALCLIMAFLGIVAMLLLIISLIKEMVEDYF